MRITSWLVLLLPLAACSPLQPGTGSNDTGTDTGIGSNDTSADTGTNDTGTADTGTADTGTNDTGTNDTGTNDTGIADTGDTSGGITEAGTCTFAIPSDAIVGNVDVVVTEPNQVVWLCKSHNVSVAAAATGTIVFVEKDGDAVVNSSGAKVYMKQGSRLALFQPGNDIWLMDTGELDDQSNGVNPTTLCTDVVFDYTNAPSPHDGCP